MSEKTVFISHFTGEEELATLLKNVIETKFLKMIKVFSSSNPESLQLGDQWLSEIKTYLENADLIIVLCSPISVTKPWINFEAGCGFVRGIPVIPLCHSGLKPSEVCQPLAAFQGAEINSAKTMKSLFTRIADVVGSDAPVFDEAEFFNAITTFENKMKNMFTVTSMEQIASLVANNISLLKTAMIGSVTPVEKYPEMCMNGMEQWEQWERDISQLKFSLVYV